MNQQPHHIVRNAVVKLEYNGFAQALVLQQEVKEWVHQLLSRVEEPFTGAANEPLVLMDELTVDISIDEKDWRPSAMEQVLKQLKEKIQSAAEHLPNEKAAEPLKTKQLRLEQVFLYYLEYGFLPWYAVVISIAELEEQLLRNDFFNDTSIVENFLKLLRQSPWSNSRLAEQFSTTFLLAAVQKLTAVKSVDKTIATDFMQVVKTAVTAAGKRESLAKVLQLLPVLFTKEHSDEKRIYDLQQQLTPVIQVNPVFANKWERLDFESNVFRQLQSVIVHSLKDEVQKSNSIQSAEVLMKEFSVKKDLQQEPVIAKEAIYISNAGLVLAAHFLPALFNRLGIVKDNNIINNDFAVCITQYLSTGDPEVEEYELVLPKILCGLHPSFPVNTNDFFITGETEKEMNALLSSIVEHWSILKDTSLKGLQESFLRREGKVLFQKDRWQLTVEQKPYDMLLKQLPWNISMLQLPWMKELLVTEWIY